MKFSYITIALIIFSLSVISFCDSSNTNTIKKNQKVNTDKKNVLTTVKNAATVNAKKSTIKISALKAKSKAKDAPALYVQALIDPAWKYEGPEKIKSLSKMEKVSSNRQYEQAQNIQTPIFTSSHAEEVSKLLKGFLGTTFKKEASEAFQSFSHGNSVIQEKEVSQGFAENTWKIEGDLDSLSSLYFNTYAADKKKGLKENEFVFMMVETVFDYNVNYECKNCFQETRTEIKKFFNFVDCDTKGFIHAVNLFDVLKQMKGGERIKSVSVNDWLLKEDYRGIGRLDNKQFSEAVLRSLYEENYLT